MSTKYAIKNESNEVISIHRSLKAAESRWARLLSSKQYELSGARLFIVIHEVNHVEL